MDAQSLTHSFHGKWHGSYGVAPCPVCQIESRRDQNALTLRDAPDGRLLMHCKKSSCSFHDILAAFGITSGEYQAPLPSIIAQRIAEEAFKVRRKVLQAKECWNEARNINGTVAETYLRFRGVTCPLPTSLRFHGSGWHGPTTQRLPTMVAAVSSLTGLTQPAIHRTYLHPEGSGKAFVEPAKMMLGQVAGGGVILHDGPGPLVVAEGIEKALSLMSGLLSRKGTVVASLSTSGMQSLLLPEQPGHLIVCPDGDQPGRSAALKLAERASLLGWRVETLNPPDGSDFNDLLFTASQEAV